MVMDSQVPVVLLALPVQHSAHRPTPALSRPAGSTTPFRCRGRGSTLSRRSEASGSPPCILRTPCAPLEDRHSILRPAHSLSLALHRQRSTEPGTTTLPHSPSTRLCLMRNEECDGPRCMASPLLQRTQATGDHPATRLSRQRPLPPLGPLRSRCLQGASRTQHRRWTQT